MDSTIFPAKAKILRNIAISFFVLTVFLLVFIGYTTLSRAVIKVKLNAIQKEVTYQMSLGETKFGSESSENFITTTFLETTETVEDVFLVTGTNPTGTKSGGVVKVINNTSRPQPLIATTRLLTSDNLLFRLKENIKVPASGSVLAVVEADQDGSQYNVGPSKLTIPGLSPSLQADIYATSESSMVLGGGSASNALTEQDLENARQSLRKKIVEKAKGIFESQIVALLADDDFITQVINEKVSAKAGDKVVAFTMETQLKIIGVSFDKAELKRRIIENAGGGVTIFNEDSMRYTISDYNPINKTAIVSGKATVGTNMNQDSSIFSATNFVGATPAEVKSFLANYEGIKDVIVEVSPYWQRHLPKVQNRIKIEFQSVDL